MALCKSLVFGADGAFRFVLSEDHRRLLQHLEAHEHGAVFWLQKLIPQFKRFLSMEVTELFRNSWRRRLSLRCQ